MPSSYEFKNKKNNNNNDEELACTMPKNLLVWRKTSLFLKPCNSTISFGSRRVCSRVETTWRPMPPLKSLIDASSIKSSPSSMGAGSWEPGLGLWELNVCPFCFSAGSVADFLLLRSSLSLFFAGWTKSSSFHHVLALLLSPPLKIHLFNPRGKG